MAYTTRTTVIAAYRTLADAEAAAQDLQRSGVAPNEIDIQRPTTTGGQYEASTERHEGGISGWFKSLVGSDDETNDHGTYERALNDGNCLLSVDATEDRLDSIEAILNSHSPVDIHTDRDEDIIQREASDNRYDPSRGSEILAGAGNVMPSQGRTDPRLSNTKDLANTGETTRAIPVVQEELQVEKRRVLRGGVRVYSRVVEEAINESVDLREEHVRVDRRPVDRAATEADFAAAGREQVVEVEEFQEQPMVSKQARVVEEVRIGKDVTTRTENVKDTVRRTEVKVENLPAGSKTDAAGNYDDSVFRQDFQRNYASAGDTYETYGPAYRYGYDAAADPRYRGKRFEDIESNLRSDYATRYPGSSWEKFKGAVRTGWNKVTGKI